MSAIIEPRVLKGFRDFLPPAEIERRLLVEKIEASFRSFGFLPIDTPALEYAEILLGKGGGETEKQIYRFADHGGRDVALRFDLTVPFARFLAEHRPDIALPFKRYHIAKVWRGENTQRGRYREFTQCDFDTVGSDTAAADFEILLMIRHTLNRIDAGDVTIRVNHRGLFNRFLERTGVADKSAAILRTVDKLAKVGPDATREELEAIAGKDAARDILGYIEDRGSFAETLAALTAAAGGPCAESERLSLIRRFMIDTGTEDSFVLDPSITRGLDYYTGIVYETFLKDLPGIGSVCSGGRYDDLAGLYSKEKLSGVGSSIGLDRLVAALESLGKLRGQGSYAQVAVACVRAEQGGIVQALAQRLRDAGINCEVFLEEKKLPRQYSAAEKKGIPWMIIPDDSDTAGGSLTLRNLATRENREGLDIGAIAELLQADGQ
jgi:histidyl-tRNA synthetase